MDSLRFMTNKTSLRTKRFGEISLLSEITTAVYVRVGKMKRVRMSKILKVQGFRKRIIISLSIKLSTKLFQTLSIDTIRKNKSLCRLFQN